MSKLFCIISFAFVNSTLLFSQNLIDNHRKKDVCVFLEYNQFDRGFLSVEADCRYYYGDGFPAFRIFGFSSGYNFWHNDWIFEQKSYFNFLFLSAGLSLSVVDQLGNSERAMVGIKPQIGFDIYVYKFYYGYQFAFGNRPEYLNYHNFTFSFFMFARNEFYKWNDKVKWYSWDSIIND